jgi:outer membrane protein OmpA-like peptidoglycan-associated protein
LKKLIDNLNNHGSLLVKLVIATGVIVVFSYCAFSINFFPKGLTLGDSLVFIFVALGFGVFYLVWLAIGYFALYAFTYPFSKKLGKNDSVFFKILMIFVGFIFLFFLFLFYLVTNDFRSVLAPLASGLIFLMATFFGESASEGLTDHEIQKREKARVGIIILAFFIAPLIGMKAVSKIVDSSFRVLGINQNNVSLVLSEKNYEIVSGVARSLEVPLFGCELVKGTTRVIHNTSVLWHGIGDKSLIALLKPDNGSFKSVARLELESQGTNVLKILDSSASFNACINLGSDTLFKSYESTPSPEGLAQLDVFTQKIQGYLKSSKLEIVSAEITGYTDRKPVLKNNDTNYDLSLRRANSVFASLSPLFDEHVKKLVKVTGKGELNPRSKCSNTLESEELKECLSVDRRVEIKFQLRSVEN